ncbi:MAG: LysR substrate-binding domain-containing protein [Casimicrobiaceae bacterium]
MDWPEPTRGPTFSDTAHTMQAAVDGQGIARARSTLLGNDVHNGLLVRLFDVSVPGNRKYYLAYPPRLANSPKLALFRQWVLAEIAAEPPVPARGKGGRRAARKRK